MEMLCDWNSLVAFHAGEVQATCAISSVVDFQTLLCTILVLQVVFKLKTKPTPSSRLHSRQQKSQTRTLTLSLYCHRPCRRHCWLQCRTRLASDDWRVPRRRLACWEAPACNQGWESEEEKARDRSRQRITRQLLLEDLINSLRFIKRIGLAKAAAVFALSQRIWNLGWTTNP